MAMTNPVQFVEQTRAEIAKVTWPTRREVVVTSIMVFTLAIVTAIFFGFVDFAIRSGLRGILALAGGG